MTTKLQALIYRQLGMEATGAETVRRTTGGNLRAGPGTQFVKLAVVNPNMELVVIEQPEGEWLPAALICWVHQSILED